MSNTIQLFRAKILHFPQQTDSPQQDAVCYPDGALAVRGERILAIGNVKPPKLEPIGGFLNGFLNFHINGFKGTIAVH